MKIKINYNHSSLNVDEIEEELEEVIKKDIYSTYISLYKDIDVYLFNDYAYRLNKDISDTSNFDLKLNLRIKNSIYQY